MKNKKNNRFVFCFNPVENGGEALLLSTDFIVQDGKVHMEQELSLQSYGRSAQICLGWDSMTPENLEELAMELRRAEAVFKAENDIED